MGQNNKVDVVGLLGVWFFERQTLALCFGVGDTYPILERGSLNGLKQDSNGQSYWTQCRKRSGLIRRARPIHTILTYIPPTLTAIAQRSENTTGNRFVNDETKPTRYSGRPHVPVNAPILKALSAIGLCCCLTATRTMFASPEIPQNAFQAINRMVLRVGAISDHFSNSKLNAARMRYCHSECRIWPEID